MEHLWTPWRSTYVTSKKDSSGCIFCAAAAGTDEEHFVIHRGAHNFVMLNRFPYTSGHIMIAPNRHVSRLAPLEIPAANEMMQFAGTAERALTEVYGANGLNLGMNLGEAAGAGIAGHIHLHVLPRWIGDTNFMTVVGNARVMPELLEETFHKLKTAFAVFQNQRAEAGENEKP